MRNYNFNNEKSGRYKKHNKDYSNVDTDENSNQAL